MRTAIFIKILIQKTNRFERAPSSEEIVELISVYTIIPKEDDLQELIRTPKFIKANNWPSSINSEPSKKPSNSKTSDSKISP